MKREQVVQMMQVLLDDMKRVTSIIEKTDFNDTDVRESLFDYYDTLSQRWDDLYKLSWK